MNNQSKIIQRKKKSYNLEGHAQELIFSCYHQYNYLNYPICCTIFMEELLSDRRKYQFHLWAYVLMPNHVHLLIYPYQKNYDISIILQSIKGKMSTSYRNLLLQDNTELFEIMCGFVRLTPPMKISSVRTLPRVHFNI